MSGTRSVSIALVMLLVFHFAWSKQSSDVDNTENQRAPHPKQFAIVFSFGYGSDQMPQAKEKFAELLQKIKKAGFNTIHCTYTSEREQLCKEHSLQMMLDFVATDVHHVYKSADKAEALARKLRNNPTIWGYNIWNDNYGKTGTGRKRDVNTVRQWDPTHPTYTGTYRTYGISKVTNADVIGYYDFHWQRGRNYHFPHLLTFHNQALKNNSWFYRWLATTPGRPGAGNFNRCNYSAHTTIACGGKGILWFLGTSLMNQKDLQWTDAGKDVAKVNLQIASMAVELAKFGNAKAIYSTPMTKTANNDELPDGKKTMMPPGLEQAAFPNDFDFRPVTGAFVCGQFIDGNNHSVYYLANHNAYVAQDVKLAIPKGGTWQIFDRENGSWQELPSQNETLAFTIEPGSGQMIRGVK